MDRENIMFYKESGIKSYTIIDLHILGNNMSFGYEDSYNYYDIDVDKILLLKKSDEEYFIRYNDVNKKKIVPLQTKINNFYFDKLHVFTNNITLVPIHIDDNELFRKCREIWNKITELIGINNPRDFVETDLDYDDDEFIMVDVHENTSFVLEDNYRYGHNKVVIVLHSVINDYLKTSLVQHKY